MALSLSLKTLPLLLLSFGLRLLCGSAQGCRAFLVSCFSREEVVEGCRDAPFHVSGSGLLNYIDNWKTGVHYRCVCLSSLSPL